MLYQAIKRQIERGTGLAGLREKMDLFLLGDRLTQEQYAELVGMMPEEA